jgi:hypothetical protein
MSDVESSKRILQCHSRGNQSYSPFFCSVKAFGKVDSIENHYQCAKRFESCPAPKSWRAARKYKHEGFTQIGWQIGSYRLPVKSNALGTSFAIDDWGIQYYIALWHRHLSEHPDKVGFAQQFDDFEDPFKGNFPFCQADVIRVVARTGVNGLLPYFSPLKQLLKAK